VLVQSYKLCFKLNWDAECTKFNTCPHLDIDRVIITKSHVVLAIVIAIDLIMLLEVP